MRILYVALTRPRDRLTLISRCTDKLEQLDLLVDGPFVEAQKSIELKFRGSTNQRVLDVPASLAAKEAVC